MDEREPQQTSQTDPRLEHRGRSLRPIRGRIARGDSYVLVLGLLLLSYLFTSLLPNRGWAGLAVVTVNACTFLAAVPTSRPRAAVMRGAAGAAVVAVGLAAVAVLAGGESAPRIVALLVFSSQRWSRRPRTSSCTSASSRWLRSVTAT